MTTAIHTIFVADDEPITLRAIQSALTDMGFAVRSANDGTEGWALFDNLEGPCPELLITDIDMPGCGGEELAKYARERCPGIKLLFTSGLPQPALLKSMSGDAKARFLEKPFLQSELLAVMHELAIA